MAHHRHSIGLTRREALQAGYSGLLGIPPGAVMQDRLGRTLRLNRGEPIEALFTGDHAGVG